MDLKKYLTKELAKKLAGVVYDDVILPAAKEAVAKTDTPYDDVFLGLLDKFIKEELLAAK